jgi:putative acetyltransferase
MIIREERPDDVPSIHAVTREAFGQEGEALLVDLLRRNGKAVLSLVAEDDGVIFGHILFSPVTIGTANGSVTVPGLAPMAVRPDRQRQGIGSLLVRRAIDLLRQAGHRAVVVLGHPDFYPRFGFVPASSFGIRCEYDVPEGVFMALELVPGGLRDCAGLAKYGPEFAEV